MADGEERHSDLPFSAEYAKSNRSSCKSCKESISKDSLRMSIRTKSQYFDGMQDNWFHFACFWKRVKSTVGEADVRGIDNLKWDDQEQIRHKINGPRDADDDAPSVSAAKLKVQIAKSAAGKCKKCSASIPKGEAKIGVSNKFHHVACFTEIAQSLGFTGDCSTLEGFDDLEEDMQKSLTEQLAKTAPAAKRKATDAGDDASAPKKSKAEENAEKKERAALKKQSEDLWSLRAALKEEVHKADWKELLRANEQAVPSGDEKLLDRLTDCMLFGALQPCPDCKDGQLVYSTSNATYMCTGDMTAWTKCQYRTGEPARRPFEVSEDFGENDWLVKWRFVDGRARVMAQATRAAPSSSANKSQSSAPSSQSVADSYYFARGKSAKSAAYKSGKSVGGSQKLTVKGGAAVDPECDVADKTHIYKDSKGQLYNAILGKADIQRNTNSYYKLQLLEHDKKKRYWVFRSWGRTGTEIGGAKTDDFSDDLAAAKDNFTQLYAEKSGNAWAKRQQFEKKPNCMYPIEVDYGEEEAAAASTVAAGSQSQLPKQVQSLIRMIFDIEQMKQTMREFEIDLNKMPLGKLSRKQIEKAYEVLTELQGLMDGNTLTHGNVLDATNRFYTIIPHDFGMDSPRLLDDKKIIQEKSEMLDNLLEIEVAYSIIKGDAADSQVDPLDAHYAKLNTALTVVEPTSDEFKLVKDYVSKTHAKTHSSYSLTVKDVFCVDRNGERDRYGPFAKLHNRMLLWHGSRATNYAGILSQGLRIAPPEAPATGYMFGKGVYFADMVSKSANYCFTSSSNDEGLLMLCEVALGDMMEELRAKSVTKLPAGKHSCKGVGSTMPDRKTYKTMEDGVVVPIGKGVNSDVHNSSLLYNEYIVYDVAQINIKYLIRMKFNYNY